MGRYFFNISRSVFQYCIVDGIKDLEVEVRRVGGGLIEVIRREYEMLN